eukprot:783287-Rhodomonas_salina.3
MAYASYGASVPSYARPVLTYAYRRQDMVYADPFVGKEAVRVRDRANQTHEALFAAQTVRSSRVFALDFVGWLSY